ncbi:NERD domain-containing protein [Lysinibacillus sp. BW-2-10]|nr:NERD domain-containing protein [Lysinibacillus sp. BW-2-10]
MKVGGIFLRLIERKLPSKILVLDALNRRAPNETVSNLLKRAVIGYEGELKVDRVWEEIGLSHESLLYHNYETNKHQIDTLFVSRHFIFVVEIKTVSGYIWYEKEKHQFLRKRKSGEIESFQSPIEQVKRNADMIERVVEGLGLSMPIYKAVVIAEPSTVIGRIPDEIPIFHAIGLRSEIKKLLLRYSTNLLPTVHFELLVDCLMKLYQPSKYWPRFELPPIRKGALCTCGRVMTYKRGFICVCGNKSNAALLQGLHDYRVLISEWITNREFRDFFFIESEDAANKLMKRMQFTHKGSTRDRRYLIPKDIWRDL